MAQSNTPAKTMSSRLLTMKFMQRAAGAAASPSSSPGTPNARPAKKQRLSNGSYHSSPSTSSDSDAQAIREAIAAEERRREEALEREAADRGETKWYLSFHEPSKPTLQSSLRVVSTGYAILDRTDNLDDGEGKSSDDEQHAIRTVSNGRRSFGRFNKALEKQQKPDASSSDSDSSSESEDDQDGENGEDDPSGADAMIVQARKESAEKARAERKAKRKAFKAEADRLAAERRKKHVNLNQIRSISGGGGSGGRPLGGSPAAQDVVCYNCNHKGHMSRNCPEERKGRKY